MRVLRRLLWIGVLTAIALQAQATVPISVSTSFVGLYFTIDSVTYNLTTPFNWTPGTSHSLSVTSPQYSCGNVYVFTGWSVGGTQNQNFTTPAAATNIVANFAVYYQLRLSSTPVTGGTLNPSIPSADGYYLEGTTVQVTPSAASGFQFAGWGGHYSGTANPLTVQMNGSRTVEAVFSRPGMPAVTLTTNPPGYRLRVDGANVDTPATFEWNIGSTHTISPIPVQETETQRYVFSSWNDGAPEARLLTVGSAAQILTANLVTELRLTTSASPNNGGTIAVSPDIEEGWVPLSTGLRLTATPAPGYRFERWSGGVTSAENPLIVTMDTARQVSAVFSALAGCTGSFARPGDSIAAIGEVARVDVTADPLCSWTVSSDAAWLVLNTAAGTGRGAVRFVAQTNPTAQPRIANISFGANGPKYVVTQAANGCAFSLSPQTFVAQWPGGAATVMAAGPSSCTWTAVVSQPWIVPTAMQGAGGTALAYSINSNQSGPRTGSITIAGQTLRILQNGAATPPTFSDVLPSHPFFEYIHLLNQNVANPGCGAAAYCPEVAMTRSQMAYLVIRSLYGSGAFASGPTPYFSDVPASHPQFAFIQKMKEIGITNGCTATTYCPDDPVTRGQMAAFLVRAKLGLSEGQTFPFAQATNFADVPPTHLFYSFVQKLRELGITAGCTVSDYCPNATTTRSQMAVFLVRAFF